MLLFSVAAAPWCAAYFPTSSRPRGWVDDLTIGSSSGLHAPLPRVDKGSVLSLSVKRQIDQSFRLDPERIRAMVANSTDPEASDDDALHPMSATTLDALEGVARRIMNRISGKWHEHRFDEGEDRGA